MAKAKNEKYGQCRLCWRSPLRRQDSHLVPQWSYKRIREAGGSKPDPVVIQDGRAHPTSQQLKEHMLCYECEQRFSPDERYLSNLSYQLDGSVPFLQEILPLQPAEDGWMVTTPAPSLEVDRIVRFASICLWRCHSSSQVANCELGEKYGDAFRRFLNEETPFPAQASLTIIVPHNTKMPGLPRLGRLFTTPYTEKRNGYHAHRLLLCGLQFEFAVGNRIPDLFREFCIVRGSPRYVIVGPPDHLGDWLKGPLHRALRNARKRRD